MRFVTILTAVTAACVAGLCPSTALAQSASGTKAAPSPPGASAPSGTAAPASPGANGTATDGSAPGAPGAASAGTATSDVAAPSTPQSPEDAKLACIASFDEAQRERNAGHFLASRAALIQCSEAQCGDVLAGECTRMYADVEAATPSVVFSAHDAARNADRSDVAVTSNGKPLLERLDGKPVPLDPGQYKLEFKAAGVAPVSIDVVIRTGEKYRVINVVFPAPEPVAPVRAPAAALEVTPEETRSIPTLSYVFGGLGVAGVGAFVALRLIGGSDFDAMKDDCAPNCAQSDIDNVKLKYLLSNVALGVGAASLGAAIVIYSVAPSESEAPSASVALVPTVGGSRLVIDARF